MPHHDLTIIWSYGINSAIRKREHVFHDVLRQAKLQANQVQAFSSQALALGSFALPNVVYGVKLT